MYRRLFILSVIILTALAALSWLGFHSLQIQTEGLQGRRWGEFVRVAEQIRLDVKAKLDAFIQTEQNRPYTDYQQYYVAQSESNDSFQNALLRSPLSNQIEHGLAFGYFQIEPDKTIITPYIQQQNEPDDPQLNQYITTIREKVLPRLNGVRRDRSALTWSTVESPVGSSEISGDDKETVHAYKGMPSPTARPGMTEIDSIKVPSPTSPTPSQSKSGKSLPIESLKQQQVRVERQSRSAVALNTETRASQQAEQSMPSSAQTQISKSEVQGRSAGMGGGMGGGLAGGRMNPTDGLYQSAHESAQADRPPTEQTHEKDPDLPLSDIVEVRIEPFVPLIVESKSTHLQGQPFPEQIYLIRHVQIEDQHLVQGFRLDNSRLLEEVRQSAQRLMREGMCFDLQTRPNKKPFYAAVLDFGFANLTLNLNETNPAWIDRQMGRLQTWYFSIITIVFVAVGLGLLSLWRNLREQARLAEQKDHFISAVSHELRTPLTSIRMYTEMLEKDWIASEQKRNEYYVAMRQESERLTRLIENVLDFSRLQRGKMEYHFHTGDLNACVSQALAMITPYASQAGFSLETDFDTLDETTFDRDAVMQIVINLVDNAVKYARGGADQNIIIRTRRQNNHTLIEVEDHGPGLDHRQREKIFDEFYRAPDSPQRTTTGVGLGLALVKKFALAHKGFVDVQPAAPSGAVFRVALTTTT